LRVRVDPTHFRQHIFSEDFRGVFPSKHLRGGVVEAVAYFFDVVIRELTYISLSGLATVEALRLYFQTGPFLPG